MTATSIAARLLNPVLVLHVLSAIIGLMSGFVAMALRKGSGFHAAAGTVFFVSMLSASATGAGISLVLRPNTGNAMVSLLTFYLVSTAWVAARRRHGKPGVFDLGALLLVIAIGVAGAMWGVQAVGSKTGLKDGYPPLFFLVFALITLLFASSDVRMMVHGGVFGSRRIARHLVRMCLAMLLAILSSQGRVAPQWLRETNFIHVPAVLIVGLMIFWLYRVLARKRALQDIVQYEPTHLRAPA
jgi:uncharacterized membrane protein